MPFVGFDSGAPAVSARKRGKPIPRKRAKPRRGPVVDLNYQAFVRTFRCVACFGKLYRRDFDVVHPECAHVGRRGISQKCSDYECLPLCVSHHRTGRLSHHVLGKRFWTFHNLDRQALIAELNRLYDAESVSSRRTEIARAEQHGQPTRRKR